MRFDVTILGSNSATPMFGRHPSAQVLCVHDHNYLIDCGEGTQMRMLAFRIKRAKLDQIFISHLHGDHCYGIFGLLWSLGLGGRTKPLTLFAPVGIKEMFEVVMKHTAGTKVLPYPLHFCEMEWSSESYLLHEDHHLTVHTIPLIHGLPATGFLFKEKEQPLRLRDGVVEQLKLEYNQLNAIKQGADYHCSDGTILPNAELTLPPRPLRSYAYCSDTLYNENIIPIIKDVNMLYHEATFLHQDLARATQYFHTTAYQAGQIALKANAKRLLIGHFSSRYEDLDVLLNETKSVFDNTTLAIEGSTFEVV